MATDPVLRMLGLARRAGKLAYGDELVREACFDHKTRCVFIAGDAGANAAKKAAFYADKANVPCVTLPHGKLELGSAIGKAGCAMCAVADIGMAAAAVSSWQQNNNANKNTLILAPKNKIFTGPLPVFCSIILQKPAAKKLAGFLYRYSLTLATTCCASILSPGFTSTWLTLPAVVARAAAILPPAIDFTFTRMSPCLT